MGRLPMEDGVCRYQKTLGLQWKIASQPTRELLKKKSSKPLVFVSAF